MVEWDRGMTDDLLSLLALSTSGVCLGRSPGFRRKDVDLALKVATLDDF